MNSDLECKEYGKGEWCFVIKKRTKRFFPLFLQDQDAELLEGGLTLEVSWVGVVCHVC